ncbi:MAG: hypothetical protein UV19_C0015G0008, partial [Parcubacteria group bacterium GW2011_GWA2_42_28]
HGAGRKYLNDLLTERTPVGRRSFAVRVSGITPLALARIRRRLNDRVDALHWIPPLWFVGFYEA